MKFLSRHKTALLLIAASVAAAVLILQHYVLAPYIGRKISETVRTQLGITLSVGRVGGSYFSNLTVHDIRTVQEGQGLVYSLSLDSGEISYSLPALLSGLTSFINSISIELRKPSIAMNTSAGEKKSSSDQRFSMPMVLPLLNVYEGKLHLKGNGYEATAASIDISMKTAGAMQKGYQMEIKTPVVSVLRNNNPERRLSFASRLRYTGENIKVSSLLIDGEEIVDYLFINLEELDKGDLSLSSALNVFKGRLKIDAGLADSIIDARIEGDSLSLTKLSSLPGLEGLALQGRLSIEGGVHHEIKRPDAMKGSLNFRLQNPSFRGVSFNEIELAAEADAKQVRIKNLSGSAQSNRVSFSDISLSTDMLLKKAFIPLFKNASGAFSLHAENIPAIMTMAGLQAEAITTRFPAHTFDLAGSIGEGRLIIEKGNLHTPSGTIHSSEGVFTFPEQGMMPLSAMVETKLDINVPDLRELAAIFNTPPLHGSVTGKINLSGPLSGLQGFFDLQGKDIAYMKTPPVMIRLAGSLDKQALAIETAEIEDNDDRVSLSGAYNIATGHIERMVIEASVRDLAPYADAFLPQYAIKGALKGKAELSGALKHPELSLHLKFSEAGAYGIPVRSAELELAGSGDTIEIIHAALSTDKIDLSSSGTLSTADKIPVLFVGSFHAEAGGLHLELTETASLEFLANGYSIKNVELTGDAGTIHADGIISADRESNFTITVQDLKSSGLAGLMGNQLQFADGAAEITLSGSIRAPILSMTGTISEFGTKDMPFFLNAAFDLRLDRQGLFVNSFEWSAEAGQNLSIQGFIPYDPFAKDPFLATAFDLSARLQSTDLALPGNLLPSRYIPAGAASVDFRLSGTWDEPSGRLEFQASGLDLPSLDVLRLPHPLDLQGKVIWNTREAEIQTFQAKGPGTEITLQGRFSDLPLLKNSILGKEDLLSGTMAMHADLDLADINWIARSIESIRRLSGQLQASIELSGPLRNPKATGTLRLADGELRTLADLPSIRNLQITARADEQRIILEEVTGELGAAPFSLTGIVEKREEGPPYLLLDFQGENLLLVRNEGIRIRSHADLRVEGLLSQLVISGDLIMSEGRFSKNFDFLGMFRGSGKPVTRKGITLFSIKEPPLKNARFDINLTSENPFEIKNNLARGSIRHELKMSGTGELPVLIGVVYIDSGRINLPAGWMQIESGIIRFPENDPDVPVLNINAQSRMMGHDITATVTGPYYEPVVTLSSSPPLPEDELLLLILAGTPPKTELSRESARKSSLNVALYLGKGMLSKWFGSESTESDESILDRLNVEIGRGITKKGDETIDAQFLFTEDLIKKGDTIYITTEKDEYDSYNLGLKIVFRFK